MVARGNEIGAEMTSQPRWLLPAKYTSHKPCQPTHRVLFLTCDVLPSRTWLLSGVDLQPFTFWFQRVGQVEGSPLDALQENLELRDIGSDMGKVIFRS